MVERGPSYYEPSTNMWMRPIVGLTITDSGYFAIACILLWTLYAPVGLVAYVRQMRLRGEYIPPNLSWLPDYVWPQGPPSEDLPGPKNATGVQKPTERRASGLGNDPE